MLIKSDPAAAAAANSTVLTACRNCGLEDRLLLHHVRHRGVFRRLCTTCVLRLHPNSFCPTCFQVYPTPPSSKAVLTCVKCYSASHSHCVETGSKSPSSPYICPLCVNPTSPIFKLRTAKDANVEIGDDLSVKSEDCRVMDRDAAKKLLAAAKIASASMNKAAAAAKAEAERRAKEAAFTRKRAKEALEHVARLVVEEKLRKKEAALAAAGEVEGPGPVGIGGNVGYVSGGFNGVKFKREYNVNVCSNSNGIVGSVVGPSVVVEEKVNTMGNVDRLNNSNQVLVALNEVELRENEKMGGKTSQGTTSGVTQNDDQELMDVDEKGRMMVNGGENVGEFIAGRNNGSSDIDHTMFADMEITAENLNVLEEREDDLRNEVVLVQTVADQMHYKQNNNSGEHANAGPL